MAGSYMAGTVALDYRRDQSVISPVSGDFPGGPVANTPHSPRRGPRFDPWSGD